MCHSASDVINQSLIDDPTVTPPSQIQPPSSYVDTTEPLQDRPRSMCCQLRLLEPGFRPVLPPWWPSQAIAILAHIMNDYPQTKFLGGLSALHLAESEATVCLGMHCKCYKEAYIVKEPDVQRLRVLIHNLDTFHCNVIIWNHFHVITYKLQVLSNKAAYKLTVPAPQSVTHVWTLEPTRRHDDQASQQGYCWLVHRLLCQNSEHECESQHRTIL